MATDIGISLILFYIEEKHFSVFERKNICITQRLFESPYLPDLMLKAYRKLLVLHFLKLTLFEPILVDWLVAIGAVVEKSTKYPKFFN